jgi:putative addiction module antidote
MGKLLKIVRIGDEVGVVLPPEVLDKLEVELGDEVRLDEAGTDFALVRADANFEALMAMAEKIMAEDRAILRVLAQ